MHIVRARGWRSAFTLVEIMIVVAIIGLLAAIALPNFAKARSNAQIKTCVKNLTTIESAKQIWGLEKGKTNGDEPTAAELYGPDLYIKVEPVCPTSGTYTINAIGSPATCSKAGDGHSL
jgi:prepilin-type N-terminal cleavage/methylation domain-containing protein